jgi:sugar lactone lactonase YvrE
MLFPSKNLGIFSSLSVLALAGFIACSDDDAATPSGPTPDGGTDPTDGSSDGDGGGGDSGSADTGTGNDAGTCPALPAGPIAPGTFGEVFDGSEDFAFDGKGHMAAKSGTKLILVDGQQASTDIGAFADLTFGLRYHPNGNLVAALPSAGKLVFVSPSGQVSDLATSLVQPNGVYVDAAGTVWVTQFSTGIVSKVPAGQTAAVPVFSDAANTVSPNGIVVDEKKKILFYTEYSKGKIHRVSLTAADPKPTLVTEIPGAALDGLVLDVCGNVYVVDQGNSRLYRVQVDATGAPTGNAELLSNFPSSVANAQFGSGTGFEPKSLYVTGTDGIVYTVAVGVGGAAVPTQP